MKKALVAAAALMVLVAAAAWAQQAPGRGMRSRGAYRYDPARQETISGQVGDVREFTSRNGLNTGIHVMLNTAAGSVIVVLGPKAYLDQQPVAIAKGDQIEVAGVKAMRRGQEVFLAGEVKKNGQTLRLRDEAGVPLWAGTGPRPGARAKAPVGC